jgi:hypothetical protein
MRILISPAVISIFPFLNSISSASARGEGFNTNARLDFIHNSTVFNRGRDEQRSLPLKKKDVAPGLQDKSQWISSVDRHTFLNAITRRIIDANASESCRNENEELELFGNYFNSYDDPYWFYYSGTENGYFGKDFSTYYLNACTNNSCDYTDLAQAFKGTCEVARGVLYSVSSVQTCSDGSQFTDTNFPICAGESCAIDKEYFISNDFHFCSDDPIEFNLQVTKEEPAMSKECIAERNTFTEASGYGDPDYVYSSSNIDADDYCVDVPVATGTSYYCDFTPLLVSSGFKEACEAEGGILYKFSDIFSATEGYYEGGEFDSKSKNIPVCIGSSCVAKNYFEKLIFPHFYFVLGGDFKENDEYIYTITYTPTEYAPVLDEENPYSKFLLKSQLINGKQVDTVRRCKWLAKKSNSAKERMCTKKRFHVYSEQGSGIGPASNVCVQTCAPYCREEKGSEKFIYAVDYDNQKILTKQCKWLERQPSDKIAEICGTAINFEESIYKQASIICTSTCGTCV